MSRTGKRLLVAMAGMLLPLAAFAQPAPQTAPQTAGVEFQLGTETMSANDARVTSGGNIFKLGFVPGGNVLMFYERINETFSFKNGGSRTTAPGEVQMEGVGIGYTSGNFRFELMTGQANTFTQNGNLVSSDPVTDLGAFFSTHPGQQRAIIEVGLVERLLTLSSQVPGTTIVAGSTQAKELKDMGGLLLRLSIGFGF